MAAWPAGKAACVVFVEPLNTAFQTCMDDGALGLCQKKGGPFGQTYGQKHYHGFSIIGMREGGHSCRGKAGPDCAGAGAEVEPRLCGGQTRTGPGFVGGSGSWRCWSYPGLQGRVPRIPRLLMGMTPGESHATDDPYPSSSCTWYTCGKVGTIPISPHGGVFVYDSMYLCTYLLIHSPQNLDHRPSKQAPMGLNMPRLPSTGG